MKKSSHPQILFPKLMRQIIIACSFVLTLAIPCIAQNQNYDFKNPGPYTLYEDWVIVKKDTIRGAWNRDTFMEENDIKFFLFKESGIMTIHNFCLPPTDLIFKTQTGLDFPAAFISFRIVGNQVYLLGFSDFNKKGEAILNYEILLQQVRYNPMTNRVTGYQNGRKVIVRNPISTDQATN